MDKNTVVHKEVKKAIKSQKKSKRLFLDLQMAGGTQKIIKQKSFTLKKEVFKAVQKSKLWRSAMTLRNLERYRNVELFLGASSYRLNIFLYLLQAFWYVRRLINKKNIKYPCS